MTTNEGNALEATGISNAKNAGSKWQIRDWVRSGSGTKHPSAIFNAVYSLVDTILLSRKTVTAAQPGRPLVRLAICTLLCKCIRI
jgi:hypothetical protein